MTLEPLQIAGITLTPPVMLAPMAGYTDSAFRTLCLELGCSIAFTEVVNSAGVVHDSGRTLHMLAAAPGERPLGAHIYGTDPDTLATAASIIEQMERFDLIDINCGCPVRKITAKGAGAALIGDPALTGRIVNAVRCAVSLPVTVKTRIGLAPGESADDLIRAVEDAGASAIFVHARYACHRHRGPADWNTLARIKAQCGIPVIGNGGIATAADVQAMVSQTGVDGVMIGRAALGNPWIFGEIRSLLAGVMRQPHTLDEHRAMIVEHLRRLTELKELERKYRRRNCLPADQAATLHFRAHLYQYLSGLKGRGLVRRRLNDMQSTSDILDALDTVVEHERAAAQP